MKMLSFSSAGDPFPAPAGPKGAHYADWGIVKHPAEFARVRFSPCIYKAEWRMVGNRRGQVVTVFRRNPLWISRETSAA